MSYILPHWFDNHTLTTWKTSLYHVQPLLRYHDEKVLVWIVFLSFSCGVWRHCESLATHGLTSLTALVYRCHGRHVVMVVSELLHVLPSNNLLQHKKHERAGRRGSARNEKTSRSSRLSDDRSCVINGNHNVQVRFSSDAHNIETSRRTGQHATAWSTARLRPITKNQNPWTCQHGHKGQRAKGKGQRAKGKGQRAKGKGQRAKGKGQRAKGKGQRAKGKGQRAKGKGQRAKGNGQRATGKGQQRGIDTVKTQRQHKKAKTTPSLIEKMLTDRPIFANLGITQRADDGNEVRNRRCDTSRNRHPQRPKRHHGNSHSSMIVIAVIAVRSVCSPHLSSRTFASRCIREVSLSAR